MFDLVLVLVFVSKWTVCHLVSTFTSDLEPKWLRSCPRLIFFFRRPDGRGYLSNPSARGISVRKE